MWIKMIQHTFKPINKYILILNFIIVLILSYIESIDEFSCFTTANYQVYICSHPVLHQCFIMFTMTLIIIFIHNSITSKQWHQRVGF